MRVFVTGFDCFAECSENPTKELVTQLASHAGERPTGASYKLGAAAVLEVSAEAVRHWIDDLYSSPSFVLLTAGDEPVVVLHLGVDVTGQGFKLECQAANEATFRVPDQRGWRPQQRVIDDHPGLHLGSALSTSLDVPALEEVLRGRGHAATVQQSQDAGRFVCNWCYYHSLLNSQMARQAKGAPLHALFLHVPPTAAIPLDCQFAFLLDLLDAIAQQLTGGAAVAAAAGDSGGAAGKQQRQSPPEPAALR